MLRKSLLAIISCLTLVLIVTGTTWAMSHSEGSSVLGTSAGGLFTIELTPGQEGLMVGSNEATLMVTDSSGAAVTGADLSIKPWMPEMDNGVFTAPVITELGDGRYKADKVGFNMPGRWQLVVTVNHDGRTDEATLEFPDIQGEMGAMDHDMADQGSHMAASAMGLHNGHGKKGWMLGYKYMRMGMDGLLDGTDTISASQVIAGPYMMSPTSMTMDMQMLMAMYGLTDKLTLMAMFNHLDKEMDMVNGVGVDSTMSTDGFGDIVLSGNYKINTNWLAGLGLSLPTGSIDEKVMMMGSTVQAPYPMQLGSGTYDLIPSITYTGSSGRWRWGSELEYTARLGDNDNDYSLGDRWQIKASGHRELGNNFMANAGLVYSSLDEIDGQDPNINPMMAPTGDPDAQGGERLDLVLGLSDTIGGKHTFSVDYSLPIYQDLNGPQLETDYIFSISYKFMTM